MAAESRSSWGCVIVFAIIWLSGVAVFDWLTLPGLIKQWRAGWEFSSAQGTVLESRVIEEKGDESTSYRPYIRYQYQVGDARLNGDRYRFGMNTPGRKLAGQIVRDHPPGSSLKVWYSPESPADSILDRELSGQDLFLPMFLTPFHAISVGFLLLPWFTSRTGPGGVPVLREGLGWRARLNYVHPLSAALAGLGCLSFLAVLTVGFATEMNPSAQVMRVTWSLLLVLSAYTGLHTMKHNQLGKTDLRIESGQLEYAVPLHGSRVVADTTCPDAAGGSSSQRQSVALSQIESLKVVTRERRNSEGAVYTYELQLNLCNGEIHGLRQWHSLEQARIFANWLQGVTGVKFCEGEETLRRKPPA